MLNIFPKPYKLTVLSDKAFLFEHFSFGENLLSDFVIEDFFDSSSIKSEALAPNVIFRINDRLREEEYTLKISDTVTITSKGVSGQIYALQTLKQIVFQSKSLLPEIEINDMPRYEIRGCMLDPGRYFIPLSDVKAYIRRMASHKLNFLHLHLTEDQGFRVQIDKYPLLTEVGSKRTNTNFNHKPHGGYYTKSDISELVDYAHAFGMKVMPEFDIPGHSRASIAAYKELSCFERQLPVATHWGVKHDVLCAGKESTYDFVFGVIDELCEMFPDEYIHIGGDEVPKHRWHLCSHCQSKMKQLGLENEDELQFYFMNRVKDYCKNKGRQVFMWSWDLKENPKLDEDLGFTLCGVYDNIGSRPFIDTSTAAYYLDLPYGRISLNDTASHKVHNGNCKGLEGTLWGEYIPNIKKGEKMLFPRALPMCETAWCGECGSERVAETEGYYYSFLDSSSCGYAGKGKANPSKIRGFIQNIYFEKRQLTWEGLHNLFDDRKIEKLAKKLNDNS